MTLEAKAKAKAWTLKAKAKAKAWTFKAKAKAKDTKFGLEDPRGQGLASRTTSLVNALRRKSNVLWREVKDTKITKSQLEIYKENF